jgi:hypothetical protein
VKPWAAAYSRILRFAGAGKPVLERALGLRESVAQ